MGFSMAFLEIIWLGKPVWMWLGFHAVVLVLLALDLGFLNKGAQEISIRKSLKLSAFYISLGVLFGGWVWMTLGADLGLKYLTGFVIEKSLSIDNVFVIAMIFGAFAIPRAYQYRVLFWGVLAVILLRGLMIGIGAALVQNFGWILYVFAAFLVFTGIKMLVTKDAEHDIADNALLKWMRRHMRITPDLHGQAFFVRTRDDATGKIALASTPLFVVLVLVNVADVIFAVDSVPAIFAITTDPFIVYTSNIFAILGLRALYFALAAMIARFAYLKYALAVVLVFIGGKIFIADMLGLAKIPPLVSLGGTLLILGTGVGYSLWKTRSAPSIDQGL